MRHPYLDRLVEKYGTIVIEIDRRLRAYQGDPPLLMPDYFVRALYPLAFWPSCYLRAVGSLAWQFPPFVEAVTRLTHIADQDRRGDMSPVRLGQGVGRRRLKDSGDAWAWDDVKKLPDAFQDALLGKLMVPMFGDAGDDDDAVVAVADAARDELKRIHDISQKLHAKPRSHASLRSLRTLRRYERLLDAGVPAEESERQIANEDGVTIATVHGACQRARDWLRSSASAARDHVGLAPDEATRMDGTEEDRVALCPDHGLPTDDFLTCSQCRREFTDDDQ